MQAQLLRLKIDKQSQLWAYKSFKVVTLEQKMWYCEAKCVIWFQTSPLSIALSDSENFFWHSYISAFEVGLKLRDRLTNFTPYFFRTYSWSFTYSKPSLQF